jgi:hypothetical protein
MKKIAIYGDSFAADFDGWPKFLKSIFQQKYGDCEVITYGIPGTSSDYSYARFRETHKKYDLIIFLWTAFNRSSIITIDRKNYDSPLTDENSMFEYHASAIVNCEKKEAIEGSLRISKRYTDVFSKLNDIIKKWIIVECDLSIEYVNKNMLSNLAMRDSVKFNRPDSINIEVFDGIVAKDRFMANIQTKDLLQYSRNRFKSENTQIRKNHLTLTQNKQFAEYLFKHINGEIDIHDTFEHPEKYYTMSKSLEESGFIL